MSQLRIPAISSELKFIATHTDEADDIRYGDIKIHPLLEHLSNAVYMRADKDVEDLLDYLKDNLEQAAKGRLLRTNNWHWPRGEWPWEVYSEIYWGLKGRTKNLGWIGLHVGYGKEGFRLIGFMKPRGGGLDRRKKFAEACKKKIEKVHLTRENQRRYPGWSDYIIWFDRKLKLRISREELANEIRRQAKRFFTVAKPHLRGAG
jgi:hypothetical protein